MDAYECLLTRRSIRSFTDKKVSDDLVQKILTAGMYAPSARNERPWHFIVIRDRNTFEKIMSYHPYAQMLKSADVLIAVVAEPPSEENKGYCAVDCSAATENILLAAHALGLGSVWLGVYPREERMTKLSEVLNLPENIIPISLVAIGYPAIQPTQPERFDLSRIHYEKW
jgi:nitroreductase